MVGVTVQAVPFHCSASRWLVDGDVGVAPCATASPLAIGVGDRANPDAPIAPRRRLGPGPRHVEGAGHRVDADSHAVGRSGAAHSGERRSPRAPADARRVMRPRRCRSSPGRKRRRGHVESCRHSRPPCTTSVRCTTRRAGRPPCTALGNSGRAERPGGAVPHVDDRKALRFGALDARRRRRRRPRCMRRIPASTALAPVGCGSATVLPARPVPLLDARGRRGFVLERAPC